MEKKRLGESELMVSALGLGCMGMSEFYGTLNDEESSKTIHHALDLGMNFLDTADMYGMGKNEELAKEKGCQPSQLALAWLLAKGEDIVPIPGMKTIKHLKENIGALKVKLTADDLVRIDKELPRGAVAGASHPPRR